MQDALTRFPPTRRAALERLSAFVPHAGRDYAARRNYDLGRDGHVGVSTLSPYLRARLMTEAEVVEAVLGRHSPQAAEKFIQEVFWRTYWKGWLELRPAVWIQYKSALKGQMNAVQTQSGLRDRWTAACTGQTEIECFNAWANELVETGYLHNHARMWFASIWIFTLRLPWELGADFFLRHLLDGDPASNTLGWRWVAGIQTPGKTYLARTSNISKYTEGRYAPKWQLAGEAAAIPGPPVPERSALPESDTFEVTKRTGLLLHDDDLSPGYILDTGLAPRASAIVTTRKNLSPLAITPHVDAFATAAADDAAGRYGERLGEMSHLTASVSAIVDWAAQNDLQQIVTPYAPVGPNADLIARLRRAEGAPPVKAVRRAYDSAAWPHATHGFFRFKDKIPSLIGQMRGLSPAT
ncbi:FAD-binding domain-containing protein [uncultured Tateyamaria sp.]|uniref:FAD-binding domain-containing protein n=1 Tax=uncultured Tateyamaria sp. TaxID=455651 RepID=UPI002639A551|nr:FAD-binding domain-containing protein [uncultured Tateyamaria sp.]